jgi:hypothetical protein
MHSDCDIMDTSQNPIDDRTTDLAGAVESLSDDELRDLLVALLSEWRKRCDVNEGFHN